MLYRGAALVVSIALGVLAVPLSSGGQPRTPTVPCVGLSAPDPPEGVGGARRAVFVCSGPGGCRQRGRHVRRILAGARPQDLPVVQVSEFDLVVNLKSATALGLTIPQSVLLRADEVIK